MSLGMAIAGLLIGMSIEEFSRRWYIIQKKKLQKEGCKFKWYE